MYQRQRQRPPLPASPASLPPSPRQQQLPDRQTVRALRANPAPRALTDVELRPGERGLLLGMTGTGKSTLADALIAQARNRYPRQRVVVLDSKPRWRGDRELNGLPATWRYRNWDDSKQTPLPGAVVLGPGTDATRDVKWAWAQGYTTILAQITRHADLAWLTAVMRAAYEAKRKNEQLLLVVDETNHFFRGTRKLGTAIVEILTSGRENSVGMLLGGQRPRNISVEAIESCTNLYWFYTPYAEDQKQLRAMGVPPEACPGADGSHQFYFFSRKRPARGLCKLPAHAPTPASAVATPAAGAARGA